jgi:hypothetical protein
LSLAIGPYADNFRQGENVKNLLRYAMLVLVVALVGSTAAYAIPAPEVDPGMAISAFALLAGAVTVLRVRRSK